MRRFALLPLLALATPAVAQETPVPARDNPAAAVPDEDLEIGANDIVVVASRMAGQVDAPQPPLLTLDEGEIASYGASSITELIEALGPQTTSSRGRGGGFPVMLINGQRISNFREIRNIPTEAIRRMEVLPEEVALQFGYPPNQRVVNMILKDSYSSRTVDLEYHRPTEGGYDAFEAEASLFQIAGKSRLNLTVSADDTSPLTEAERGIIQQRQPIAGDPHPADFRTLVSDGRNFGFNGTWTTPLGTGPGAAGLTVNAAASTSRSTSFSGLASAPETMPVDPNNPVTRFFAYPLMRQSKTDTYEAGVNLNKPLGDWRLTATVDASTSTTTTLVARRPTIGGGVTASGPLPVLAPAGEDSAKAKSDSISSLATLMGRPFTLPAGEASATLKLGFAYTGITSSDTRSGGGETKLNRGNLSAGINLGLPITSRREEVLGAIGDISLNFSAGLNRLSDFGTLYNYSGGVTWGITSKLSVQASYIVNEAAPSLANLGNPTIETFFAPVYDFRRNETALVTLVSGGNPNLVKEKQRDIKVSANWELPFLQRSSLQVEYIRNNSDDVTNGFPLLTPAIEAAYPGRVTRGPCDLIAEPTCTVGPLQRIDQRPVTFDKITSSRLRYGINLAGPLGKPQEPSGAGAGGRGAGGPGGRGPGGGGFGRPGGGGNGQGRWNLAAFHTYRFDETVRIAPGGPVLDLLGGDALSGGGVSRHTLEVNGGAFYRGFGVRFNGTWAAPTRVSSVRSDLRFGSAFKLDLRAFVNLDQQASLVKSAPFFKGARIALEVDNLFNARQRITDATGQVPLNYQPGLVDPRGRVIGIDFRKQF